MAASPAQPKSTTLTDAIWSPPPLQARRWMPHRPLILVADSGFAALELLAALARRGVICVTRLRLDAALYGPAPPRRPGAVGRPRTRGPRLPNLSEALVDKATPWRRVVVPGWC